MNTTSELRALMANEQLGAESGQFNISYSTQGRRASVPPFIELVEDGSLVNYPKWIVYGESIREEDSLEKDDKEEDEDWEDEDWDEDDDGDVPEPQPLIPYLRWWCSWNEEKTEHWDEKWYRGWQEGELIKDCLWHFLRLVDAPNQKILDFSRKWGVLGICANGLPGTFNGGIPLTDRPPLPDLIPTPGAWVYAGANEPFWYWESLDDWRRYSRKMMAFLQLKIHLSTSGTASKDIWKEIWDAEVAVNAHNQMIERGALSFGEQVLVTPWKMKHLWNGKNETHKWNEAEAALRWSNVGEAQRRVNEANTLDWSDEDAVNAQRWLASVDQYALFADHLQYWIRLAALTPTIVWNKFPAASPHLVLELAGLNARQDPRTGGISWPRNSLFSVLVAQLIAVITSSQELAYCDSCGNMYQTERKPAAGRYHFCPTCRENGDASRYSKRKSYHRLKAHIEDV